ncbi:aminotransferase-like domain-containing protein [Streptomyces litchfieldiae]|uniref:PLP-dependent aminotransferase family protein n=1 Tax=Streptomyces litchfieldiae TaxID=3075543 RepID=A0ABU2MWI6_9ACTN|nr:PLP-dependent aminotransferase family protein [Streptomyces sp. DSM 44938]MDT0345732.1 PLP-dependent aminotransferase family protein [Streptomyces sp. DSM 44938]
MTGAEPDLLIEDLHSSLVDPALETMNFLNEVAARFPGAVSFAAGRPHEEFYDLDAIPRHLRTFQRYLEREKGVDPGEVRRTVLQYGRTKGVIHELLARNLRLDEGIDADPQSIVVTVGCQEAMFLVLRALCAHEDDIVLAVAPRYVGLTGAARLLDREVWPVRETASGVDLGHLVEQIAAARAASKRPRACYLIPDFANPSGLRLDLGTRKALLAIAERHDLLLLEDNPYGLFQADDEPRPPTLKALDTGRRVIYLGSLAKTCFPGARVGYLVADQRVATATSATVLLADEISKLKSMLTINTSPLTQAIVAGRLLEHGCSLVAATRAENAVYRRNMRLLREGLERRFPRSGPLKVTWNAPAGGFFVVLTVPFAADDDALEYSARHHGVLWTPMTHFYGAGEGGGTHQMRLSVSVMTPEQIDAGLERLLSLVTDRAGQKAGSVSDAQGKG